MNSIPGSDNLPYPMLPHWTHDDLAAGDVRLHYYRTGRGEKRPLVLVHGFSDHGLCWAPVARDLEAEYDVIMPDMRAHGLSGRVQPGEKADMAADLAGLIRSLDLKSPIVGGHSMGAMITFMIGVRFPELASALVLEDPPWWLVPPVRTPSSGEGEENQTAKWARDLPNRSLEELLVQYRAEHPGWPEETVRLMAESKKQFDPAIVDTMANTVHAECSTWLKNIKSVTRPTLLITADPGLGGIVTPEAASKARELNPGITIVKVPGAGHLIRYDNYPAFMSVLRAFLKRIFHH